MKAARATDRPDQILSLVLGQPITSILRHMSSQSSLQCSVRTTVRCAARRRLICAITSHRVIRCAVVLIRAVVCSEGDSCSTGFSELSVTTSPSKSDPGTEATSAKAGNAYADYVRPIPCNFYDACGRANGCASAAPSMQLANCLRTRSRNCMHAVHGWSLSVPAVLYRWRLLLSIAADCNATVRSSLQAPDTVTCVQSGQLQLLNPEDPYWGCG